MIITFTKTGKANQIFRSSELAKKTSHNRKECSTCLDCSKLSIIDTVLGADVCVLLKASGIKCGFPGESGVFSTIFG